MKAISSSIVILAGLYGIIVSGPLCAVNGMAFFGLAAGIVTLALGLVGWWACLKYD